MDKEKESLPGSSSLNKTHRWARFSEIGLLIREQWPKYIVDVLVIILSITISFTFDSYKEESSRKSSEQAYLKALQSDMESDINELKERIAATQNVVNRANRLLTITEEGGGVKMDTFAVAIKEVMQRPNFTSKDATFSDLTSSGNMLLVEDINLKAALFEYHRFYESVRAVEKAEQETVNTNIAPYLMKFLSIKGLTGKGSVLHQGVTIDQLLRSDDFSNVISLRLVTRSELLYDYQQELVMAEKIKDELQSKQKH